MNARTLALTTINPPNAVLRELSQGALRRQIPFFIAGDTKSPENFTLEGATFLDISDQNALFPEFAEALPIKHYARKNIAYLAAMRTGCEWIQETDDDNFPLADFWTPIRSKICVEKVKTDSDWINVYRCFTEKHIWPRGFPLELIAINSPDIIHEKAIMVRGLIRQGLANNNPDVDAVYRLTSTLPFDFADASPVMPEIGLWCPFNSQNTIFHREVFSLLYLPSFCSFRMTDIWRSFVAQRCLWELGENVVFHSASVAQERNAHDLLKDFEEEISGYLNNRKISTILSRLEFRKATILEAQFQCYEALVCGGLLPKQELDLLVRWQQALP